MFVKVKMALYGLVIVLIVLISQSLFTLFPKESMKTDSDSKWPFFELVHPRYFRSNSGREGMLEVVTFLTNCRCGGGMYE